MTDAGLCHVLNGNSIGNTYVPTERIEKLNGAFGSGDGHFQPTKIRGTGYLHQRTFWLDVGIRLPDLSNELIVLHSNFFVGLTKRLIIFQSGGLGGKVARRVLPSTNGCPIII